MGGGVGVVVRIVQSWGPPNRLETVTCPWNDSMHFCEFSPTQLPLVGLLEPALSLLMTLKNRYPQLSKNHSNKRAVKHFAAV